LFKSKFDEGCKCKRLGIKTCKGFFAKDANAHARIKLKTWEFKHAMVEIKYGITTDLPVGKGSKFKVF